MQKLLSLAAAASVFIGAPLAFSPAATANGYTMTLTGTPKLGETMTVQFNEGVTPVGEFFDIWICPDQTVLPNDNNDDNGQCEVVTFWLRAAVANFGTDTEAGQDPVLSMKWVLSSTPTPGLKPNGDPYLTPDDATILVNPPGYNSEEPETFGGWCQFDGWYFNVNDYSGGSNSNWSAPFEATGCDEPPAPGPEPGPITPAARPELANTGTYRPLGLWWGAAGLIALGATLLWVRRQA